jgi:hypothetical protein
METTRQREAVGGEVRQGIDIAEFRPLCELCQRLLSLFEAGNLKIGNALADAKSPFSSQLNSLR